MSVLPILDLYCGAGLVADGLIRAGFAPHGVDNKPQRRYPGEFLLHDALTLEEDFLDRFRAIWASPPCLRDTAMKVAPGAKGDAHPDLITPTRAMLQRWAARTGGLWVIENVERAKLIDPVILCGSMFGLGVTVGGRRFHLERHRKIETNWPLSAPRCSHKAPVIGVYGGHPRCRAASAGGRGTVDFEGVEDKVALMREAMGVARPLTGAEVSQGVPPAYSRFVAEQMLAHMQRRLAA